MGFFGIRMFKNNALNFQYCILTYFITEGLLFLQEIYYKLRFGKIYDYFKDFGVKNYLNDVFFLALLTFFYLEQTERIPVELFRWVPLSYFLSSISLMILLDYKFNVKTNYLFTFFVFLIFQKMAIPDLFLGWIVIFMIPLIFSSLIYGFLLVALLAFIILFFYWFFKCQLCREASK